MICCIYDLLRLTAHYEHLDDLHPVLQALCFILTDFWLVKASNAMAKSYAGSTDGEAQLCP